MAYDLTAPMQAIKTLLAGLNGIQAAHIGVPASLSKQVEAWVVLGAIGMEDKTAGGTVRRMVEYYSEFCYAVEGDVESSELAVVAATEDLTATFYRQRGKPGGAPGTGLFDVATTQVVSGTLDLSLGRPADYPTIAGTEFRRYGFAIRIEQRANLSDFD